MLKRGIVLFSAICLLMSCGDENSSGSAIQPEYGESSSSFEIKISSSSSAKSSSSDAESSSSSQNRSSSSNKPDESSISEKSSSSEKKEVSSSSENKGSSSEMKDESSSSEESSSSVKPAESSSSEESSSSVAHSSSSEESSSSAARSSSSEKSSSSAAQSSSSEKSSSSGAQSSSSECSSSSVNSAYDVENNTLTDLRDGQVYKTATIGAQVWMAENLNYIPDDTVGTFFGGHSVCGGGEYKSMEEGDCSVFGRLYDVKITSSDGNNKNICPDGWSVPNAKQWNVLIEFLDEDQAGERMKLNDKIYWPNSEVVNESGFSAIPSGYYSPYSGFNKLDPVSPAVFTISSSVINVNAIQIVDGTKGVIRKTYGHGFFIAIRCIKN